MSEIKDGGPAFPCDPFIASKPGNETVAKRLAEGMSLRDYFAAKALVGLFALEANPRVGVEVEPYSIKHSDNMAECAYVLADSMLRAREAS